jgi:hypothetical protein
LLQHQNSRSKLTRGTGNGTAGAAGENIPASGIARTMIATINHNDSQQIITPPVNSEHGSINNTKKTNFFIYILF